MKLVIVTACGNNKETCPMPAKYCHIYRERQV